jgi:hypothetical protein
MPIHPATSLEPLYAPIGTLQLAPLLNVELDGPSLRVITKPNQPQSPQPSEQPPVIQPNRR